MKAIESNIDILKMALLGYERQDAEIRGRILELRKALGLTVAADGPTPVRRLSPAARKRIAMAQKKRWAKHRAEKKAAAAGN